MIPLLTPLHTHTPTPLVPSSDCHNNQSRGISERFRKFAIKSCKLTRFSRYEAASAQQQSIKQTALQSGLGTHPCSQLSYGVISDNCMEFSWLRWLQLHLHDILVQYSLQKSVKAMEHCILGQCNVQLGMARFLAPPIRDHVFCWSAILCRWLRSTDCGWINK